MARQPSVAIYARVSTDEQNPDAQLRDLREYAANRGWKNVKEYVDLGVSGAKDSRPKWNELWDAIQKGRVHVLVDDQLVFRRADGQHLPDILPRHRVLIVPEIRVRTVRVRRHRSNRRRTFSRGVGVPRLLLVLIGCPPSCIVPTANDTKTPKTIHARLPEGHGGPKHRSPLFPAIVTWAYPSTSP